MADLVSPVCRIGIFAPAELSIGWLTKGWSFSDVTPTDCMDATGLIMAKNRGTEGGPFIYRGVS